MNNDSISKTLTVAIVLCVVCSVLVSGSAVLLRPKQVENQKLDIKKNLLLASGLLKDNSASKEEVLEKFKMIETKVINLETGEVETSIDPASFNQKKAATDRKFTYVIPRDKDIGGIIRRSKFSKVYFVKENGMTSMIVLPVHGKGLWSTLYGFFALGPNLQSVKGIGFYQHGETPGLGGEVDNVRWKKSWQGKKIFDSNLNPLIKVMKGPVDPNHKMKDYQIDGLSGATITSNGVTNLIHYWLGDNGFNKFLANYKAGGIR